MSPQKQLRTFISYSRANKQFAIKLATELKAAGFLIWLDQFDIPTGKRWDDEIEKALRECEIFMIVMTPASIASENAKDEIGYAIDHGKRIMPVLLEECEIPLRLRRLQYVDFSRLNFDEGIDRAKELLSRLINEETVPAPARTYARKDPNSTSSAKRKERATYPSKTDPSRMRDFSVEEPVNSARKRTSSKSIVGMVAGIAGIVVLLGVILGIKMYLGEGEQNAGAQSYETAAPEVAAPTESTTMLTVAREPSEMPAPTESSPAPNVPSETPEQTATVAISDTPTPDPGFYTEEFDFLDKDDLEQIWQKRVLQGYPYITIEMNKGNVSVDLRPQIDVIPWVLLLRNGSPYDDVKLKITYINKGFNPNGVSLICGYGEQGWFEFRISNTGSYWVYAFDKKGVERSGGGSLFVKQYTKIINSGKNSVNEFSLTCTKDELALNINGNILDPVKLTKHLYTGGQVGIGISALPPEKAGTKAQMVQIEIESVTISQP